MIFRFFSKLPSISSPLNAYLEKVNQINLPAELIKRSKLETQGIKEQSRVLRDLEQASIFRLRELTNDNILSLLKAYTFLDQGSKHLYSALTQELYKRINSFNFEDLSTILYFFSSIKDSSRLNEVVKEILMKDPLSIPANSIGKIAFAFAVQNKYDSDLFKVLTNIFIVAQDEITQDTGVLFLTGAYKVNHTSPALYSQAQIFIEKYWKDFNGEEIAHIIFILYKFGLETFADKKILEADLSKLKAGDIDKIIGCFISKNKEPPKILMDRLDQLLEGLLVTSVELFGLIYSLSFVQRSDYFFPKIYVVIGKVMNVLSSKDKLMIFLALLNNKKENEETLRMFSAEFEGLFESNDILMLFPCFVRRGELFLPYTQKLIENIGNRIKGRELNLQDTLMVMYSLCKVNYQDPSFWKGCLDTLKYSKITSAEEYIQVKKTIKEVGKLGVDIDEHLNVLVQKYESS